MTIHAQLAKLDEQKRKLLKKLDSTRANRRFRCACGKNHAIKTCIALQTHWFDNEPYSESWVAGEIWIVCANNPGLFNRVLFSEDYELSYTARRTLANDADRQFKSMYLHLFKAVHDIFQERPCKWYNNYYFDKNRKKFELVELTKKSKD